MNLQNLRQINEDKKAKELADKRHKELLLDNTATQQVIVKSISSLVNFLDNKITKTEVVNQLKSIATPDVENVVKAVDDLHTTLKTHENTDLSEVTKILSGLLEETKQIPKDKIDITIPEQKDYVAQLNTLAETVKAVEKAVKSQKLNVEAPVVNVPAPNVNVEAPNLKPISESVDKSSKDVVKAVKGIKIPEFKTDSLEKLLKKTNKLLQELPDYMPSGGGGGSSWVAVDENGIPMPIQLNGGLLPTSTPSYDLQVDDTGTYTYLGNATPGTATSAEGWRIKRVVNATGVITHADGVSTFTKVWTDRSSYDY